MNDQLRARFREGGGIPVPVRALTEGLGGTCEWDSATGAVACTVRGVRVVLTPGSKTVTVDGEAQELTEAPQARYVDGTWVTVAPWDVFEKAWHIDGLITNTHGEPVKFPDGHQFRSQPYHLPVLGLRRSGGTGQKPQGQAHCHKKRVFSHKYTSI